MFVKQMLQILDRNGDSSLHFMLPSREFVPAHFHVTEVGRIQKTFVDCGGARHESVSCLLQLWTAQDVGHRLMARKLAKIVQVAGPLLGADDLSVEIEYGPQVASRYSIADIEETPKGLLFVLAGNQTECLAPDRCGVSQYGSSDCC